MAAEQINTTLAVVKKIEQTLTTEIVSQESSDKAKQRRSAGNSPVSAHRSRSQLIEQIKIDQTMITELEYIHMLPDLSKFHDVNESSFLKGIGNTSIIAGHSGQPDMQQQERIKALEQQLEAHRK